MEAQGFKLVWAPDFGVVLVGRQDLPLLRTDELKRLTQLSPGTYTPLELTRIADPTGNTSVVKVYRLLKIAYGSNHWPDALDNKVVMIKPDGSIWTSVADGGPDRSIRFGNAQFKLRQGEVANFIVDPQNQEGLSPGLTRVTLIDLNMREYDVVAIYDPNTAQIFPPQ